ISCTATPSVMQTMSGMPASAASNIASGAKRAGTKITEQFAPVASAASLTESKTGTLPSNTHSPPFPGVTPATTFVPYATICVVWKSPSFPVMPCTIRRVFLLMSMLIDLLSLRRSDSFLGGVCQRLCSDHVRVLEQFAALFCIRANESYHHRNLRLDFIHCGQ